MKTRLLIVVLLIALAPLPACSNLSRWQAFYEAAQKAKDQGNLKVADEFYRESLKDAEAFGVEERVYLPLLADIAESDQTEASWQRVLRVAKSAGKADVAAKAYQKLVWCASVRKDNAAAKSIAIESSEYCAQNFGKNSIQYGRALNAIADANLEGGQPKEALQQYSEVEKIWLSYRDQDSDFRLATLWDGKAYAYTLLHNTDRAVVAYSRAIEYLKRGHYVCFVGGVQQRLMRVLDKAGRKTEAHAIYKEYLKNPNLPTPVETYEEALEPGGLRVRPSEHAR